MNNNKEDQHVSIENSSVLLPFLWETVSSAPRLLLLKDPCPLQSLHIFKKSKQMNTQNMKQ